MADENEQIEETEEESEAVAEAAEPAEAEAERGASTSADAEALEDADAEPEEREAEPAEEVEAAESPAQVEPPAPSASAKRKRKRLPRALRPQRTKPQREKPKQRSPIVRLPKPEQVRGRRQERQGIVVSAATDKTIVVRVDTVKVHPRYKKVIRRSTKLHAHDEGNEAKVGDVVEIVETRPLSKLKRWRLQRVVEAAK
jgi:small subunit ribosomal protein S17